MKGGSGAGSQAFENGGPKQNAGMRQAEQQVGQGHVSQCAFDGRSAGWWVGRHPVKARWELSEPHKEAPVRH